MDDDVEYEFEGNAECPVCGALDGTTDTRPIPPPHENCECTSKATCNNTYSVSGTTHRYGLHKECFSVEAEITVTCWNGTEIEFSLPIDFGCVGADGADDFIDQLYGKAADSAGKMDDGCPDCNPPLT